VKLIRNILPQLLASSYTLRMPELVDNLADLTALRDRDALDVALLNTINDVVQLRTAAICRIVGEKGNERWRIGVQVHAGQPACAGDSPWARLDTLSALHQFPLRLQALETQQVQASDGAPATTLFPLGSTSSSSGVLELVTQAPLSASDRKLVCGVLRLYLNCGNLLDYGERDSLTELLNRKTFDGAFLKATIEQREQGGPPDAAPERRHQTQAGTYWLAMLDIDHFKRVNDNYGHLIGDEVLLLLARLMRGHFRFHDQLYRFGGEEFVVLMRCGGESEALGVLERLRATTEKHLFPQVGRITISVGFSEIKIGDSPSGAIERADKAVYYAKEHGRNQVCSYAALIANGQLESQAANVGDMELF